MSFHTKTIERILNPVAQQVSKLILLFEVSDVGTQLPDLKLRVDDVKHAVINFVKVGHLTIENSDDRYLRNDLPSSLKRVEDASLFLEEAVHLFQEDSTLSLARKKLIDGARGIVQGTWSVLLTFDASEVRKIIKHCYDVLSVFSTSENVLSLTALADFVKRLTPCMTNTIKEVDSRREELIIPSHAFMLQRGVEQIKRLTPLLISSIKLFVNTHQNGLRSAKECQGNRDFILSEMYTEIHDIIRTLQLTEANCSDLFEDDLANIRMNKETFDSRLQLANNWLSNTNSMTGLAGSEKPFYEILDVANSLANMNRTNPNSQTLLMLSEELRNAATKLNMMRQNDQTLDTTETKQLVAVCGKKLEQLANLCRQMLMHDDNQNPLYRLSRTMEGKLVQAQRWLSNPRGPLSQVGLEACNSLAQIAKSILSRDVVDSNGHSLVNGCMDKGTSDACLEACQYVLLDAENLASTLTQPNTLEIEAKQNDLALAISRNIAYIWNTLEQKLIYQVAEVYTDLTTPLHQLAQSAVSSGSGGPPNEEEYNEKMKLFLEHCYKLVSTAELAATVGISDAWRADALLVMSAQFCELGSQVGRAGRAVILTSGPELKNLPRSEAIAQATMDHFQTMQQYWIDTATRMQGIVDEAIDANTFISAQESAMLRDSARADNSYEQKFTTGIVESTTRIARRANRVLQLATLEAENSEDTVYVDQVNEAVKALRSTIPPMVTDTKGLVTNITDCHAHEQWRLSKENLLNHVGLIKKAVGPSTYQAMTSNHPNHSLIANSNTTMLDSGIQDNYLSTSQSQVGAEMLSVNGMMQKMTMRDSTTFSDTAEIPDTETEEDFNYPLPEENQPILAAAHALHHETRHWSSRDNELVAVGKQMASLMAQLSQIVRGERGTKKDLITVSMDIAKLSLTVNQCAKLLAKECTDRRLRTNLILVSDRILTIGNQLKILSTVKATMLDAPGSGEEQENTEALVGNAQNLMQSVIDALHIAEAASIKLRVDSGCKFVWRFKGLQLPKYYVKTSNMVPRSSDNYAQP